MNVKTKLAAVTLVAALLILGTAGFASAAGVVSLEVGISNGEITASEPSYTGYLYLNNTDTGDHNLSKSGFKIILSSDNENVELSNIRGGADLSGWTIVPMAKNNILYLSGVGGDNITVEAGEKIKLGEFTVNVTSDAANADHELQLTQGTDRLSGCYVYVDGCTINNLSSTSDGTLTLVNKTLSKDTPNTIVAKELVQRVTEDFGDFINNLTIYSETGKKLTVMPGWYVNYTSANEDAVKIFTNTSKSEIQKYVVIGTSHETVKVTANLTNSSTGTVVDSKEISVKTSPGTLIEDYFDFPYEKVYSYTGDTVAASVRENLTILNFTDPANNNADSRIPRVMNPIVIMYYKDAFGEENITEPILSGEYVFNLSSAEHPNYKALSALTITNHTFRISGGLIVPTVTQYEYFNATTKAEIIVNWTVPEGIEKDSSFLDNATIIPYQHGGVSYYNPTTDINDPVWGFTNITKDNLTYNNHILKVNEGQNTPKENHVEVTLTGRYLGDVNGDNSLTTADAEVIGTYLVSSDEVPADVLFYGALHGATKLGAMDQLRLLQYIFGPGVFVNADYDLITT